MAARRCKISLRKVKNISLVRVIFFQHEKRNFLSPSGHLTFYLLHKYQKKYQTSFCAVKGVLYHVAIATVIFHV